MRSPTKVVILMSKLYELIDKFCSNGVEFKQLGRICLTNRFKQLSAKELRSLRTDEGDVCLLPSSREIGWVTTRERAKNKICNGEVFTLGKARYANAKYANGDFISSNNVIVESKYKEKILTKYLYYFAIMNEESIYTDTATYPKFDMDSFNILPVPVPPLPVQEEIVRILDRFTELENELENELEMRKKKYEFYRNKLLTFNH